MGASKPQAAGHAAQSMPALAARAAAVFTPYAPAGPPGVRSVAVAVAVAVGAAATAPAIRAPVTPSTTVCLTMVAPPAVMNRLWRRITESQEDRPRTAGSEKGPADQR